MRVNSGVMLVLLFLLGGGLASCAEKVPMPTAKEYAIASEYTFAASYEAAWNATVRAISEADRISALEGASGLLVTEYRNINTLVQNLISTPMFGKVYKNSYTVKLSEAASGKTRIIIESKLLLEQLTVYTSELQDDSLKALMRQQLFRKICINLQQEAGLCTALFPDYHGVSASCPAPSAHPTLGSDGQLASVAKDSARAKGKAISVKRIQRALLGAGYAPGPVDGRLGQKTRAAIRSFQQDKGIDRTGVIDRATLAALGL